MCSSDLINFAHNIGYDSVLLNAVKNTNSSQVNAVMSLIKQNIKNLNGKKVAILGLAFKENTDDIRESVSTKIISLLLKNGCKVCGHDPKAIDNTRIIFGNKITYTKSLKDALTDSDCAVIMTPWQEYRNIKEKDVLVMKSPIIIDTRRVISIDRKSTRLNSSH